MATKTLYMDGAKGSIMIVDYSPQNISNLPSILANPSANFDKLSFHTDFDFLRIKQEISVSNVSFNGFTRNIQSWSSGGCCFITTACCEHKGLPDDCYELEQLRMFRDCYMMTTEDGRKKVMEYYTWAPRIVEALGKHPEKTHIYNRIYEDYIVPAVKNLENGDLDSCYQIYTDLYNYARREADAFGIFAHVECSDS